ncbi:MAG: hypothetical protein ACTSRZ_14995, partial [Promethearchaeota archaeon]
MQISKKKVKNSVKWTIDAKRLITIFLIILSSSLLIISMNLEESLFQNVSKKRIPLASTSYEQIFFDDFYNQSFTSYPDNWTCQDSRNNVIVEINYNVFDPGVHFMDHLSSYFGSMYQNMPETVYNGSFEFLFYFYDYSSGSGVFDFEVLLKTTSGSNVITLKLSQSSSGNYFTITAMGTTGTTHFSVNTKYKIKVVFEDGTMDVWVNSTLEHSSLSYTSSAIGRLYFGTTAASYGTTVAVDNITLSKAVRDTPILDPIPSPDYDGNYTVNWSEVSGATMYHLFRDTSPITDVSGMTPIYSGSNSQYDEVNIAPNTYYYAVIADNSTANSSLSNIESVTVQYPTIAPVIDPIPSPDYDGNYTVNWNDVDNATIYYLFRDTSSITDVSG